MRKEVTTYDKRKYMNSSILLANRKGSKLTRLKCKLTRIGVNETPSSGKGGNLAATKEECCKLIQ